MNASCYPEIRETEIEWLKEIPKHWELKRLRFAIISNPVKSEIVPMHSDQYVSFVPMNAVGEYGGMSLEKDKHLGDVYNGYTYFQDKDVVVAKITPCFENGKGAIAENLTNGIGFGTTEFHVLRALDDYNYRWLFYLTITHSFREIGSSEMLGAGGQKRIPERFVKDFKIGFPPIDEQQQIAKFLDYKTGQIDRLIAKKKDLIEKLHEKRIAVITQAVTKGLDPTVPMRDSELEWFTTVPSHWGNTFVKFCFDIKLGKMLQPKPANLTDIEVPYLKALHVNWDKITTVDLPFMYASENEFEKFEVKNGDLLVCEGGEVGRSSILKTLKEPAIIQNALHRVRNSKLGKIQYFNYLLRNIADARWFEILCNKATISHLTSEKLGAIRIPLPPIEEQQQIAKFLDYKTGQIDQLITKKKALIEKLNEYRTALITAAVTGKIDVRQVKVPKEM